jgi:chaperonin GroES
MTKVKIKPLADRVLVEAAAAEDKTAGGIIIPDTAKEKPNQGKVAAVGDGVRDGDKLIPLTVKKGDKILYGKYSGTEIEWRRPRFLLHGDRQGQPCRWFAELSGPAVAGSNG